MIYLFIANGSEECEALAPLDILRRANVNIMTVGVGGKTVIGSHNVPIVCDIEESEIDFSCLEGIILPGGMPGTLNLEKSAVVQKAIDTSFSKNALICAICAAPSILGHKGILNGKKATCYPGFEKDLSGANPLEIPVVSDGNIITANGPGSAFAFGLKILEYLKGYEKSQEIMHGMMIK